MKKRVMNRINISVILILMCLCFITEKTSGDVTISEIMYGSEIRFSPKQWIEIFNTGTKPIDLTGWTLTIQNVDSDDLLGPVSATINFRNATFEDAPRIWPNDFLLIVTSATDDNSGDFMEDQVYDLRWREDLGISFNTTWLSAEGFRITLTDADGSLVDEAGNYDGNMTLWDLPYNFNRGRIRTGNRTSLIRRYSNGVALDGTLEESWVSAANANLTKDQKTYYGDENDISSPGIGIIVISPGEIPPPQVVEVSENAGETSPPQPVAPEKSETPEEDSGQDYIEGPWLWMVVPTHPEIGQGISTEIDSLAGASGSAITEAHVAQNGVNEGDSIGQLRWTSSEIHWSGHQCHKYDVKRTPNPLLQILTLGLLQDECIDPTVCWENNISNVVSTLGMGTGVNTEARTAYALINLISSSEQRDVILTAQSGDAIRIWLNGNVVHRDAAESYGRRKINVPLACDPTVGISDPALQESDVSSIPVTLKAGNNLLLVKVRQHGEYWGMRVRLGGDFTVAIPQAKTTANLPPTRTQEIPVTTTTISISPSPVQSPAIGERLTLSLNIAGGKNVAGYQATVQFDTTALRYLSSTNGDYLPEGAFFVPPVVDGNRVKLAGTSLVGESSGAGTLATLTFEVIAVKASTLTLSESLLANSAGVSSQPQVEGAEITESTQLKGDVNGDGTVNIQDLVLVGASIGQSGQNAADVNGDGVVNIADLVLVAGALGTDAAAPSLHLQSLEMLTATDVKQWLSQAQHLPLTNDTSVRGIFFLQRLLATLPPKENALLANYPNPFNPETWIPYQLAKPADVTLTIYGIDGQIVRRLALGHQPGGVYQNRSRAAYWDGKNAFGEPVASGVYFYTLTAGDFTATRKMLIRK